VQNGPTGVGWSVDGVPGGNASVGTISPGGLYVAPAAVPPAGLVRIRATSSALPGVYAEVAIRIAPVPPRVPAADPFTPTTPPKGSKPLPALSAPRLARIPHALLVQVVPRKAGRITFTAKLGKRRIGGCRVNAPAGRRITCRIPLRRGVRAKAVRVYVELKALDGTRLTRGARLPRG
jgi:hypothetical protein